MCENSGSTLFNIIHALSSDYIIFGIQSNDKSFGNNTFDCTILIGHANQQHIAKYIQAGHTDTIHCTRL